MNVYHYDFNGYYTHTSELDNSDKCQITWDWLIPGQATEKKPLEEKEGYEVKWNGSDWEYEKILTEDDKKVLGEILLEEGEIIKDNTLVKIEKPSDDCIWYNNEWLTTEMQKIKGLLKLEEGEKIVDNTLTKVEKPSELYSWDYETKEWFLDEEKVKKSKKPTQKELEKNKIEIVVLDLLTEAGVI